MTASNRFLAASNTILGIQMYTSAEKIDCLKLTSGLLQKFLLKTLGKTNSSLTPTTRLFYHTKVRPLHPPPPPPPPIPPSTHTLMWVSHPFIHQVKTCSEKEEFKYTFTTNIIGRHVTKVGRNV